MNKHLRSRLSFTAPVRIVMPVLLSMLLFVGTFFLYIVPGFEEHLLARKREMIQALSESALSTIQYFSSQADSGKISEEQARRQTIDLLRNLRYGPEGKDYFWITDTHPQMIMHPYRPDLEGQDVSQTQDATGVRPFLSFLQTVKEKGGGYVNYHWQWQDDPQRIFAKISYVQEFRPWHWIIGTGLYVEDVHNQIKGITTRMTLIFLGILGIIALLSTYVIWQGAKVENRRRQIEHSLRLSENKYRLLAETAREIIMLFDSRLVIRYVNPSWHRISGDDPQKIPGQSIITLIPLAQQPRFLETLQHIGNQETEDRLLETNLQTIGGRLIAVEVTFALLEDNGDSPLYFMAARDITEKKKIEAQAKLQQEQLTQTNKMVSLGTLVAGVAHEINNPISSVLLNITVFNRFWQAVQPVLDGHYAVNPSFEVGPMNYQQLRERMPKLLQFSQEGIERIKKIVGDLKEFSGQRPAEVRETVNLNQVTEKAVGLLANLIKKATDDFRANYDENLPSLQGNSQRLGQVVINLLVNACQALTDKSQGIHLKTGYLEESEEIFLEVRDYGQGMNEDILARIKDPFFTTKRSCNGTGLGLAISDTIIRSHGGWLDFTSEPQRGTTATILLPRYTPEDISGRMI